VLKSVFFGDIFAQVKEYDDDLFPAKTRCPPPPLHITTLPLPSTENNSQSHILQICSRDKLGFLYMFMSHISFEIYEYFYEKLTLPVDFLKINYVDFGLFTTKQKLNKNTSIFGSEHNF
jgi:hypothetical protein